MTKIITLILLTCSMLAAQEISRNVNYDKQLIGATNDKMIHVQPPPGKTWTIVAGSISTEWAPAGLMVWTETVPYTPFRDPVTNEMLGCQMCVNIIRMRDSGRSFFPIVGGYAVEGWLPPLAGGLPIIIQYPNRLSIVINGILPSQTMKTWTRFTVLEMPTK